MSAICASRVSLISLSPTSMRRSPSFSRQARTTAARRRPKLLTRLESTPARIGQATTTCVRLPGSSAKANSNAPLIRPESERRLGAPFSWPGLDKPNDVAAFEFGERSGFGCAREGSEGSVIDEHARTIDGDRVDRRMPAVLPIGIDLHRADREHQRTLALPGAAVEEAVFD